MVFKESGVRLWIGLNLLMMGPLSDDTELCFCAKSERFLDQLRDCNFLNKKCEP